MISKEILEKIKPGAVVRVTEIVKEGAKTRESRFQGIVLARKHGKEIGATFTVRGDVAMIGVEKVYPINSPMIEKVEIMSSPRKVSRSKLYYLRDLSPKKIREKLSAPKK
ncbi:MAG: 50S ribosomal protein L19 [Candidatus Harrisonbacteria bacterium]|nr:50S ribosomal protein L19 [Candidatus Harrisonbacteria bacterium]